MKTVEIRNVHSTLLRRADASGQSLQEYLVALLREHTGKPTLAGWLAEAGSDSGGSVSFDEAVAWQHEDRDSRWWSSWISSNGTSTEHAGGFHDR